MWSRYADPTEAEEAVAPPSRQAVAEEEAPSAAEEEEEEGASPLPRAAEEEAEEAEAFTPAAAAEEEAGAVAGAELLTPGGGGGGGAGAAACVPAGGSSGIRASRSLALTDALHEIEIAPEKPPDRDRTRRLAGAAAESGTHATSGLLDEVDVTARDSLEHGARVSRLRGHTLGGCTGGVGRRSWPGLDLEILIARSWHGGLRGRGRSSFARPPCRGAGLRRRMPDECSARRPRRGSRCSSETSRRRDRRALRLLRSSRRELHSRSRARPRPRRRRARTHERISRPESLG